MTEQSNEIEGVTAETPEKENKTHSNFRKTDLRFSNFDGADVSSCAFNEAKITHSQFMKADARYVNMNGANLEGANLSEANVRGMLLQRSHVGGRKVLFIFIRGDYTCYLLEDGMVIGGCQESTIVDQRERIRQFGYGIEKRAVMTAFLDAAEIIYKAWQENSEFRDGDYTQEYDEDEE